MIFKSYNRFVKVCKNDHSCMQMVHFSILKTAKVPGGGGGYSIYPWWGGAAQPLIPWPRFRQISLIFLPCLRQLRFLIPCLRAWLHEPGWCEFAGISACLLNATKINFAITWQPGQPGSCNQALRYGGPEGSNTNRKENVNKKKRKRK